MAKAVADLLPNENLVYLGDTARYPYGTKPQEKVRGYARQIMDYLVQEHRVKLLVVACNTAAAALGEEGAEEMPAIAAVDVIRPGVKALIAATKKGKVGVIGTTGTIYSGTYQRELKRLATETEQDIESHFLACPGFVEFVERNELNSLDVKILAERLLAPMKSAGVDALLLGCTHYPFLADTIAEALSGGGGGQDDVRKAGQSEEVRLVSSADETATAVKARLTELDLLNPSPSSSSSPSSLQGKNGKRREWIVTGEAGWFQEIAERLFSNETGKNQKQEIAVQTRPWTS